MVQETLYCCHIVRQVKSPDLVILIEKYLNFSIIPSKKITTKFLEHLRVFQILLLFPLPSRTYREYTLNTTFGMLMIISFGYMVRLMFILHLKNEHNDVQISRLPIVFSVSKCNNPFIFYQKKNPLVHGTGFLSQPDNLRIELKQIQKSTRVTTFESRLNHGSRNKLKHISVAFL